MEWWAVRTLPLIVVLAGCRTPSERYGFHELGISRQQVHEVEPLELQEAEPNEVVPEPNQAPPAEVELSLPESRALALENNLQLRTALISPSIAAAQLGVEEAKFEAAFFANASLSRYEVPFTGSQEVAPGVFVPVTGASVSEGSNARLGVNMPLRTGGAITFDLSDTETNNLTGNPEDNPSFTNVASFSISQPLLRNGGLQTSMYSIRIAVYNRDITDARTKLEVINVLAALDRVYWRLYAARRELEVRRQQYDLAQAQLDRARRLVEAGQRAQVEIIRAEAGVADQLQAIITAENSVRDRERELKRVMNKAGLDIQTPTVVVLTTKPDPVRYELDRPRLIRLAIENRMELLQLQLQLLQDASTIDWARNQALPVATLDYTYGINGSGLSRADSLDLLTDNKFTSQRAGLQVTIPIGNEAAKSRLRQYIYTRRQRLASRADREDLIRQEVLNAVDQVEANWQRILAARQTTILNGRLYEAEKRQFEQGLRTSTDVLDAQIRFANSQSTEILALTDYQIALVDVAYATGTILGSAKVQWEPIVPPTDAD